MSTAQDLPRRPLLEPWVGGAPSQRDPVVSVLLWAAGSPVAAPDDAEPDTDELLRLCDQHSLSARLANLLETPRRPPWVTPQLQDGVRGLRDEERRRALGHAVAAAEIGVGPVIVKGISTFLLTGAEQTVRCGDIDLVVADADSAVTRVESLGYKRTRQPFMHEIGEFVRGETEIDLHQHFPVHSCTGLDRASVDPAAHPGRWEQEGFMSPSTEIDWPLLHRTRVDVAVGADRLVSVPDPALLAIIICAHGFMNFTNIWSISHREKPYVKLAELADLRDLTRHPWFDVDRFSELALALDATDAIEWAAQVSEELLGSSPLPGLRASRHDHSVPRCLWWSFWADVPVGRDSWPRPDWYDMRVVTERLGANSVILVDGVSEVLTLDDTQRLPRQLRLGSAYPYSAVGLLIEDGGEKITVFLPSRSPGGRERLRVDYGAAATECVITGSQAWSAVGGHMDCRLAHLKDRRVLTLRFDPSFVRSQHILVGYTEEDAVGRPTASALVPMALDGARA